MIFRTSAAPCALLLAIMARPAYAQDAAPTSELDSVIVTAERHPDDRANPGEGRSGVVGVRVAW